MSDLALLKHQNEQRWLVMKTDPGRALEIGGVAARLTDPKAQLRYARVENLTGVPRNVIAVIHEREASQNWHTQLGQGDPLDKVSTHVPKGRGPFATWEDGAVDALKNCPPYAAKWHEWDDGGTMTLLEQYNGLGYFIRGKPSPYIWAGSDQYVSGKYVADGVFCETCIDHQLGCAVLLRRMQELQTAQKPQAQAVNQNSSAVPAPAQPNWLASLINRIIGQVT
jgi:lysozyme family protein